MPDETTTTDAPAAAETAAAESSLAVEQPSESVTTEPVVSAEQPTSTAQDSAQPAGDGLASTPQSVRIEALGSEISPGFQPVEPAPVVAVVAQEPLSATADQVPSPVQTSRPQKLAPEFLAKGNPSIQSRKRKKLDHILDLFAKHTNITNDDVEKLLHVSDATASRYLSILEKENKIKQVGKTGQGVSYIKI